MEIILETWSIEKLFKLWKSINPKPQYQRTSVWSTVKKKLLIDSILRGYDLPKFYIRETPHDLIYKFEITDGQQRMNSIIEFIRNEYSIEKVDVNGLVSDQCYFDNLKKSHKKACDIFMKFKLSVAIIKNADQEEIRTLFARLQMGERLNPVELRHAQASNFGNAIYSIVENHVFFGKDCKISNSRYKHQDYLDNAVTVSYYDAQRNTKASEMKTLYIENARKTMDQMQPFLGKVTKVLDVMHSINSMNRGIFKNKWAFVDTFYLLFKNIDSLKNLNIKKFSNKLIEFEVERKRYNRNPEQLLQKDIKTKFNRDLYDYIIAFKTAGAEKQNVQIRHRVFQAIFLIHKSR